MTTVLFWDIDGTLLTTGGAGIVAWFGATRELLGAELDPTTFRTAGLTDFAIAMRILERLNGERKDDLLVPLVRRYEELLGTALPQRRGRVLAGVRECLEAFSGRADVRSFLLTGNTRAGARAKLTYYGLWDHFEDGAFAEDAGERAAIARRALACASERCAVAGARTYVIGDTPHDIRCGEAIGARTIAVASGEYSVDALRGHSPWLVILAIPGPADFAGILELGR